MSVNTVRALVARFLAWRGPVTPFAVVTSAAAVVITGSGLVDLATQEQDPTAPGLSGTWTVIWSAVALALTLLPIALGARFPRWIGAVGTWVFIAVTALQLATAARPIISANNLVLYPMVACYVGWFLDRWTARATVLAAAAASAVALLVNPQLGLLTTWVNITMVSAFCLGATTYLHGRLERQARTDPLTGALNRAGLETQLEQELARSARSGQPLLVAVLDLDDFKRVNDTQGHAAGDRLLVDVVRDLQRQVRPYDVVARMGGDEFMLLMPGVGTAEGAGLFERLRERTGDIWSHGMAVSRPGDTVDTLTERADSRLYESKRARKTDPRSVH